MDKKLLEVLKVTKLKLKKFKICKSIDKIIFPLGLFNKEAFSELEELSINSQKAFLAIFVPSKFCNLNFLVWPFLSLENLILGNYTFLQKKFLCQNLFYKGVHENFFLTVNNEKFSVISLSIDKGFINSVKLKKLKLNCPVNLSFYSNPEQSIQ